MVIFSILLHEAFFLLSVVVSVGCGIAYSNLLFFFYRLVQISLGMRIVYYNALLHGELFFAWLLA
jgi:hypothetical protein